MKRKLDQNDRPTAESEAVEKRAKTDSSDADLSFTDLGLDGRLLQAVAKLNYEKPTLAQRKAIPLALTGQDVLLKAKTGSGKTAAYVLPLLSTILKRKQVCCREARICDGNLTMYRVTLPPPRLPSSSYQLANLPIRFSKPLNNSLLFAPKTSRPSS